MDTGTCVVPDQGESAEGAAVHHPDGEGRTIHFLLRELNVQKFDILTEVGILVGVLYHCALNIEEAL